MTADNENTDSQTSRPRAPRPWYVKALLWAAGLVSAAGAALALLLTFAFAVVYSNLPPIDALTDYRPKIPLRVWTTEGLLIGEFGEERRDFIAVADMPDLMKKAILAAEDDRFYEHHGVDYAGIARAAASNFVSGRRGQGGSTITMQLARTFFLSSERSYVRKFYEIALAYKIESSLSKDRIFEVYANQIFLGQRAYGFAAASQVYFGKKLKDLTVAEMATLAGLPVAPSAYNPFVNPKRAKNRQQYVLARMLDLGYIDRPTYDAALAQELKPRTSNVAASETPRTRIHAEFAAELARQLVYEVFRDETYTRGLNVTTTIRQADQEVAYAALRRQVLEYDRKYGYRGPEAFIDLTGEPATRDQQIEDAIVEALESPNLIPAVVLEASPNLVRVATQGGQTVDIKADGLKFVAPSLSPKAQPGRKIVPGAVVRISRNEKSGWEIGQLPQVEAAFVAASSRDGAIRALVGGFDFNLNKFNHVTQAWRQPGSSFKPFIYSAALEKGFTPSTLVNDAPISIDPRLTGGQVWEPKNYDGKFEGPMRLRQGLAKSKNLVSIRVLQAIGPRYAQDWATHFGFEADKHPAYLTMALGAGSVTPWLMLNGYSVFANGGYGLNLHIISKVTDANGKTLMEARPVIAGESAPRVLDERNAFVMDSLLKEVARTGTAARASAQLKRSDIGGKTGTTNDSHDAWFAGYGGDLVAIAWLGFDQPRPLGERETGGGLALPIWIELHGQGAQRGARGTPRGTGRHRSTGGRVLLRRTSTRTRGGERGSRGRPATGRADEARNRSRTDLLARGPGSQHDRRAAQCRQDARQRRKEFTAVARVAPGIAIPSVMVRSAASRNPHLLHGSLAVDDDPGAIGQLERQDVAGAGNFDVAIQRIDSALETAQHGFGALEKLSFGHARVNSTMSTAMPRILVFTALAAARRLRTEGSAHLAAPAADEPVESADRAPCGAARHPPRSRTCPPRTRANDAGAAYGRRLRLPERRTAVRGRRPRRARSPLRYAALRLLARGDHEGLPGLRKRTHRPLGAGLLRDEGELQPRRAQCAGAARRRIRHRLRRRTRTRAGGRWNRVESRVLGCRQERARDRAGAGRGHPVLQRRVRRRTGTHRRRGTAHGYARPDFGPCESGRRRPHPSLHFHRTQGKQVRRRLRRDAGACTGTPRAVPALEVVGIDCHIGSQITEIDPYLDAAERIFDLVAALEHAGIALKHIDFGGGLGIRYQSEEPPPSADLVRALLARLDARGLGGKSVMFEPGRSIVGNAGVLVTRVEYLKHGEAKHFAIVDAAMNDLLRPTLYDAWMGVVPVRPSRAAPQTYDIVGPVCESGDWLARDRVLALASGDLLAVTSAGAYGMAMGSNYNSRPRAAEVMVDGDRAFCVRQRERLEDLYAGESTLP